MDLAGRRIGPITDLEIAFAHLLLAGKKIDREAAEAVGMARVGRPT